MNSNKPPGGLSEERPPTTVQSSFSPTVETFAERMRRKLKEQEVIEGESQKLAESRHGLMLQALTVVRRALQETSKISLNSRFSLSTKVSDSEGWPKIELCLLDHLAPGAIDFSMIVTAHDRNSGGWIEFTSRSGESMLRLSMAEAGAFDRLPMTLKRTLRQFLDNVGNYVLNPRRPEELLATQTQAIELEPQPTDGTLVEADLFSADYTTDRNTVTSSVEEPPIDFPVNSEK